MSRRKRGELLVVGLSHKSAPVEVREKFGASGDARADLLARLAADGSMREVMFLSTCNRVEVFAATRHPDPVAASARIAEVLREHVGEAHPANIREYLYEHAGESAARHIFRVTSSLDSLVLGEPQILGQVKDAYEAAKEARTLDNYLGRCVSRAFSVAKRVRTETALGSGLVSISSVAVDLARKIFGDLEGHTVLLVGAGEMAEAACKSLGKSAKGIRVCNRSFERAAELAAHFGASAAPLDKLEEELIVSDVVVASTSSRTFVITKDMVKRVMKARKGRTLFLIDIAVPRNVDPEIHKVDNVYVFNVDDLEQQVRENLKSRQGEVSQAEAIVDQELTEFRSWVRGLDVAPTVVALRTKTKAILSAELDRTLGSRLKHLGEGDRAALATMIESATSKLLHVATTRLRASAVDESGADLISAVKTLFDLQEAESRTSSVALPIAPSPAVPDPEISTTTINDDNPANDDIESPSLPPPRLPN